MVARIRTIKPEFPQSESMGRVSRDARLTFVQMWTLADDSGRLRGNSRMLASLLFPYDDDAPELISGWLDELEREDCILRYSDESGSSYIQIKHWKTHQKIDKPSESKLPEPRFENIREPSRSLAKNCSGSRIKDQGEDQGMGVEQLAHAREDLPNVPIELSAAWSKWTLHVLESQGIKIGSIEAEQTLKSLLDRGVDKAIRDIEFSILKRCKTIRDSDNDYDKPRNSRNATIKEVAF